MSSDTGVDFESVTEFGLKLKVNKESKSPKKNAAYYCKEMNINRSLVSTALAVFISSEESVFSPPRCLDGLGASGVAGLTWKKYFGDSCEVIINDSNDTSFQIINENAETNELKLTVMKRDPCVLLHETPFSFIYLDCHTNAAVYLDSIFRNVPKRGIIALSTKDDSALYGRSPEIALRNYGGTICKTFYFKELAVRLILAGMVRSAARHNKGIQVLTVLSRKSSLTIIVKVLKGPSQADASLDKLRRLVHCNMCEDRSFCPLSLYPLENPQKLLSCSCAEHTPGKLIVELGPVWCGALFEPHFILKMGLQLKKLPWRSHLLEVIRTQLSEAWCLRVKNEKLLACLLPEKNSAAGVDKDSKESAAPPSKKHKMESLSKDEDCTHSGERIPASKTEPVPVEEVSEPQIVPEPPFYFNLHKHSPRGPNISKVEDIVICLRNAGFRASRTHFDPIAVRTDAPLSHLQKVISQICK